MKEYKIRISRYDPDVDDNPALKEYEVPHIDQGTVLEALQFIYEQKDSTLLFNYGCRSKVCGKCSIKINGIPSLACETPLEEGMVLEPLDNFPIIRDLAVDRSELMERLKKYDIVFSPRSNAEIANQPPEFFQLMLCNECLACLSICPFFTEGVEEGAPFFGVKLAELYYDVRDSKNRLNQLKTFYNCTTCQACTYLCPSQIKFHEIVENLRKSLFRDGFVPQSLLKVRDNTLEKGNVFGSSREERIEIYPKPLKEKAKKGELKDTAETILFMGCLPSYLDMKIVPSFMKTLDTASVDYMTLSVAENCCGFPLYLMGSDEFGSHAKKMIKHLRSTGAVELVTPCAGCYKTLKVIYPLIGDLGIEVYHYVVYLEKLINEGKVKFGMNIGKKVTYHDPCDIGRACKIYEQPRNILKIIPGLQYVEMTRNRDQARCCGGGGEVQVHNPDLAVSMATRRVYDALSVGADILVSACPACKDNLRKGLKKIPKEERGELKIVDITEIVAMALKS